MTDSSLAGLLRPSSIAIVGARERPSESANLYDSLLAGGYAGALHMVNPNRDTVLGQPCHPAVSAIGEPVDLVVVMVSAARVADVLRDAAASEASLCLVYSEAAAGDLPDLSAWPHRDGATTRVLGPNCLGFLNFAAAVHALVVGPANVPPGVRPGPVAIAGQSGGLVLTATEYASCVGLGLGLAVATGSEADLTASALGRALVRERRVGAVGLILEGLRSGQEFTDCAREAAAAGVPLVVLKLGRSEAGARGALTHSQSLAGSAEVFDGVCRQYGVVTASSITEFVELLRLFEGGFCDRSPGVAALTLSGGANVLVTDLADEYSLALPALRADSVERLRQALGSAGNPIDLGAAAVEDEARLNEALRVLRDDDSVGTVALVTHLRHRGGSARFQQFVRNFAALAPELEAVGKAAVIVGSTPEGVRGVTWEELREAGVVVLHDMTSLRSLARHVGHRPPPEATAEAPAPEATAPERAEDPALHLDLGRSPAALLDALRAAGVPVARSALAATAEEAAEAAGAIGYPVALKGEVAGLLHKTEADAVVLGVDGPDALAREYARLRERLRSAFGPDALTGVWVQEMAEPGLELLLGMSRDPQFGVVVTLGIGGTLAEHIGDAAFALAPLGTAAARRLIDGLRSQRLLDGARGAPAVDRERLAEVVAAFSAFCARLPADIDSLELNPVIAAGERLLAVDLAVTGSAPPSAARQGPRGSGLAGAHHPCSRPKDDA